MEAGPEVVLPLARNDGDWAGLLASKITEKIGNVNGVASNKGRSGDVILKVGERELGRISIDAINKLQDEAGEVLINI